MLAGYRVASSAGPGMNIHVNGVNLSGVKGVASTITALGMTVTAGYFLNDFIGYKMKKVEGYDFKEPTDKYFLGFGVSGKVFPVAVGSVLALPVTITINGLIWGR